MPGLREALAELAEQARPYGDAQSAVRAAAAARRRRQLLIPGAAVAAVVAIVVAVAGGPLVRRADAPQPAQPSASPGHAFPYPDEPVTWESSAPPLPADEPVGAASFVWVRFHLTSAPQMHVVMPDGRQFQIPVDPVSGEGDVRSADLSPDGRILILRTADGARLRDLSSTRQADIPDRGYSMWSPNSRWVVGWNAAGDTVLLDVDTLVERALPQFEDLFGVLDTGELLVVDGYPGGERVRFAVQDPATGDTTREFIVDAAPYLRGTEWVHFPIYGGTQRRLTHLWTAGGEVGLLRVDDGTDPRADITGESATALLAFSTTDGEVLGRIDRSPPAAEQTASPYSGWPWSVSWNPVDGTQVILLDDSELGCTITLIDVESGEYVDVAWLEYGADSPAGPIAARGGTALF